MFFSKEMRANRNAARFGAWGHATLYNMTGTVGNSYAGSHAYRYKIYGAFNFL